MNPAESTFESQRRAASASYRAAENAPDAQLEGIARLAAHLCEASAAIILLGDEIPLQTKARFGTEIPGAEELLLLSAETRQGNEVFMIPDARLDERLAGHQLVKAEGGVRFLAGVPLLNSDGAPIGVLAVLDGTPRTLSTAQRELLPVLAGQVVNHREFRQPIETNQPLQNHEKSSPSAAYEVPLRDADGKIPDSDELARSEDRYRQIFEKNPNPLWVYDKVSLAILDVNEAACEQYGYTREEFLALTIEQLLTPEEAERLRAALADLNAGRPVDREWTHLKKDGTEIRAEISSRDIMLNGLRARFVQATDLTERKQFEAQFLRAQRLESIGMLAGGIAHDLNNIFSPIMMCIEVLRQKLSDEESRDLLEGLETSAQRGSEMVRQILSFARGVEGERVLLHPDHLFREITRFIRETFPPAIEHRHEIEEGVSSIVADATQIQQVLLNLCVNARDAMPDGGRLTLRAQDVFITSGMLEKLPDLQPGPHVVIEVSDNGSGMSEEIQAQIFAPFFTTKEIGKGTGLGLSTCNAIVKNHGGQITVTSELGVGTTFRVILPAEEDVPEVIVPLAESLPRGNGETVLVVDDELSIRCITQQTLEAFGYRVLTAETGVDAIAMVAQSEGRVSVVLTDILMPEMDGFVTGGALREFNPNLKIIATSGMVGADDALNEQHFDSFLSKPFTAITLLTTIHEALHAKPVA